MSSPSYTSAPSSKTEQKPSSSADEGDQKGKASADQNQEGREARAAMTACIWEDTKWKGNVRIGDYTIIGPGCCCISTNGGAIHIGSQNVLTEGVQIINKSKEPMEIGNYNIFETGAKVEARKIGSFNLFGAQSYVMNGCKIGSGCVIGPQMQVIKNKRVADSTIMAGENLIQTQKAFKHRNRVYCQRMVKLLMQQFKKKEKGQKRNQGVSRSDGRHRSSVPRSDGGRAGVSRYRKDDTRLAPRARGDRRSFRGTDQPRKGSFVPRTDKKL